mmetsp:Transcript_123616/g.357551  ORF Transcript_123616/g.357551 Transcript_123616/m.357551 type:complete len:331 (+) Transcript_123616:113-1105(+)
MIDFDFHLSAYGLLCAAAVSVPQFIGAYLFRAGVRDYGIGCEEQGVLFNASLDHMRLLVRFIPMCALFRVLCAPALWYWLADEKDFPGALRSFPAMMWILLWAVPFVLFKQILLRPGMRCVHSSHQTIRDWPEEMPCQRPYHGLLSTRCHAACGGFYIELLWHAWTIYAGDDVGLRLGGISIPIVLFNAGMLLGGPVNFLLRGPTCDGWVAELYLLVSLACAEGMLILNHAGFGLREAVNHATNGSSIGPYAHWSTWIWILLMLVQAVVLRYAVTSSRELQPGEPWTVGGCEHKEFFFPRFWGLIYACYGMMISFNLWVLGVWLTPVPES